MEEAGKETQQAMQTIMKMKDMEANYRNKVAKFELREMRENLGSVQQALSLAVSQNIDSNIREQAWGTLMEWMEPTLMNTRRRTLDLVRRREPADDYDYKEKRQKRQGRDSRSFSDPVQPFAREKNFTVAAIEHIRTWLFHLKSKGEGLGVHLRSTGEFKARQVFLGGSCNPTSWRKDIAIPAFEKADISYYNPQVEKWTRDLIPKEAKAKADALCLLFVIDNATRAASSILEAVEYICCGRVVVLVIRRMEEGTIIDNHVIKDRECEDLNRGREYLRDVANRHGAPTFGNVEGAVKFMVQQYKDAEMDFQDAPSVKLREKLKRLASNTKISITASTASKEEKSGLMGIDAVRAFA
eukprot:CAMPEP_0167743452 /NCGR_PEP_ID=MMETSP0110_2-20121227/2024_1 /TAXON_ID=629695 /ORGANISM="Gymnochlora sp., Strain CCMP2014" /LENGTH=355 /DNA_ID=CAMNT_0007627825 /DNA_START=1120 /DNA_END=2187 /DNA_ORIENTATION=-